eukprot:CAMPEP_0116896968 /NCGR_PEP_ID=MMETSP0467-20121206/6085_1 /TAXON_ID=283647 /ORGANISM="Mesodinium pulex, Strain SPMC105" /LENGTH=89 /DNA_ID=CAMNT_0004568415 /DNA_START=98 /DNA_END=367 /DNA_ORIENTATION=+
MLNDLLVQHSINYKHPLQSVVLSQEFLSLVNTFDKQCEQPKLYALYNDLKTQAEMEYWFDNFYTLEEFSQNYRTILKKLLNKDYNKYDE